MFGRIKKYRKPDVQAMNVIEISRKNILHNVDQIRRIQPKWSIFPVLKSNAYGHGIQQMLEIYRGQDFQSILWKLYRHLLSLNVRLKFIFF